MEQNIKDTPIRGEAGKNRVFRGGDSFLSKQTVLYNSIPPTQHLSENSKLRVTAGRIMTSYAFPKASKYFIKATFDFSDGNRPTVVESEPIIISVILSDNDSVQDAWQKIKDRPDIAYFLHTGEVNSDATRRAALLNDIDYLLGQYPNTLLAAALRKSLGSLRSDETRRIEALEKLKKH